MYPVLLLNELRVAELPMMLDAVNVEYMVVVLKDPTEPFKVETLMVEILEFTPVTV